MRGYAFDLANFAWFLAERRIEFADVVPTDLFGYLDWQGEARAGNRSKVVSLTERRRPAPATMNRRIAAVRGLFEYAVIAGVRADSPVPAARRSSGLRARRGLLGHLGPGRPRGGGRLVRAPRRLRESLEPDDVGAFLSDLDTHRDRSMALAMVLGGLRAGEVRSLRLADVDMGLRRLRVVGKGNKERVVPVDGAFFAELAAYLRSERPPGCGAVECFVGASRWGRPAGPPSPAESSGWHRRCSRPEWLTATAPGSSWPRHAPTPTSARAARTLSPRLSSFLPSTPNWPTCAAYATTPSAGDGSPRPLVIPG